MNFDEAMEWVVTGFEAAGVFILVVGSLIALGSAAVTLRRGDPRAAAREASSYRPGKGGVGRAGTHTRRVHTPWTALSTGSGPT